MFILYLYMKFIDIVVYQINKLIMISSFTYFYIIFNKIFSIYIFKSKKIKNCFWDFEKRINDKSQILNLNPQRSLIHPFFSFSSYFWIYLDKLVSIYDFDTYLICEFFPNPLHALI